MKELRIVLTVLMLLIAVNPVFADGPTVTTDKADYDYDETVTISGEGFTPDASYDVPVIRPAGSIVKGDGSFTPGWDTVQADGEGAFTYLYQLNGIEGSYQVRVYPSPWGGDLAEAPLASTTFTDHWWMEVVINGDAAMTDSLDVTLNIWWSWLGIDPIQARFANVSPGTCCLRYGVPWTDWEPISNQGGNKATKSWTLADDGSGLRKVCVQTRHRFLWWYHTLTASDEIFYEKPTAITLASFSAQAGAGGVTLAWETGTEVDNAGFNLYRAMAEDGPCTQINAALIAAQGDPVSGASYSFLDTPGYGTFYYQLEDVDYYGVSTLHGPVKATVARPFRRPLYRPFVPR